MHESDVASVDLDRQPLRQRQADVVVAEHRVHGSDPAQRVEEAALHDIAGVQDRIGTVELVERAWRQRRRTAVAHVRVGEHHHPHAGDHGTRRPVA